MISVSCSHGIHFKNRDSEVAKEPSADTQARSPGMMAKSMVQFGERGNTQEEELLPKPSPHLGAAACRASPQIQVRAALRLPSKVGRSLCKLKIAPKRMLSTAVFNLVLNDSRTN